MRSKRLRRIVLHNKYMTNNYIDSRSYANKVYAHVLNKLQPKYQIPVEKESQQQYLLSSMKTKGNNQKMT